MPHPAETQLQHQPCSMLTPPWKSLVQFSTALSFQAVGRREGHSHSGVSAFRGWAGGTAGSEDALMLSGSVLPPLIFTQVLSLGVIPSCPCPG